MTLNATVNICKLLSVCHFAAEEAGAIIRQVHQSGDLQAIEKDLSADVTSSDISDPQTIADRRAEKLIVGCLSRAFPNVTLIGEEGTEANSDSSEHAPSVEEARLSDFQSKFPERWLAVPTEDVTVWIDPLDGTKEFTRGDVKSVTVLIGIAVKGRAVAGVISQPFVNSEATNRPKTVWGCAGVGVFGLEASNPRVEGRRKVVTTKSHYNDTIKKYLAKVNPDEIIRAGGCGGKALMLLEGLADAYINPSPGTKGWDTCAPQALIETAGGDWTLPNGSPLLYDRSQPQNLDGFVASIGSEHSSYVGHAKCESSLQT
eukprot:756384_1